MSNVIRLCDAGIREQEFAHTLVKSKKLPAGITYKDLLDHGVYDTSTDEIKLTVKAVVLTYKVERA